MARVLTKPQISRQEFVALISIALITLGGIVESLLGPTIWGWGCLLVGIAILYAAEKTKIWRSPILIPVILLGILSVLTWFITTSTDATITQLSRLWAGILVCLVYASWAKQQHRQLLLALGFVGIGVGLALLSPFIVEWALTKGGLLPEAIYQLLPAPVVADTVHPNIIASLMLLLMPLPAAYFFIGVAQRHNSPIRWLIVAVSIAGMMGIILVVSKSRAGLLAAGLSFIFLLWFCHYQKIAKLLTLGVVAVGAVLIFVSVQSADQTTSNVLNYGSFTFRIRVWEIAVMMLRDFPFTGVGMGTFNDTAARLYPAFSGMTTNPSAHNILLQIGADLGLIGLIAMTAVYILILYMGKQSIRHFAREDDTISWAMSAGLTTGIIAILLHGITDINVWGTRGTFAPWMVMGLISAVYLSTRLAQE